MALKYTVTADEYKGLETGLQGLYSEKDGSYILGVDGLEDTSGLKSALEKERESRREFEKQIKAWKVLGKTPEEIQTLMKKITEEEEKDKKKSDPRDEQLKTLQEETAKLREMFAEISEREKKREQENRIKAEFKEYTPEQQGTLLKLVTGENDEEIKKSIEEIKKLFPAATPPVGSKSNPKDTRKESDANAGEYGRKRAEEEKKKNTTSAKEFKYW
jgi:hypothetical protein